jgi:hypothetical protein
MSKTDKTQPWWVRIIQHKPKESHDHRNGVCDLPKEPTRPEHVRWKAGSCYWNYSTEMLYGGDSGCGCQMCTNQFGRKLDNRKKRRSKRKEINDQLPE